MCRLSAPTDPTRSRVRMEPLPSDSANTSGVSHASIQKSFHPSSWADSCRSKSVTITLVLYTAVFGGRVIPLEARAISLRALTTKSGPPIGASYHKPKIRLYHASKSVVRAPVRGAFRMLRPTEIHSSSTCPLPSHSDLSRMHCAGTVLTLRNRFSHCRIRASERLVLRSFPFFVIHPPQDHHCAARVRSHSPRLIPPK